MKTYGIYSDFFGGGVLVFLQVKDADGCFSYGSLLTLNHRDFAKFARDCESKNNPTPGEQYILDSDLDALFEVNAGGVMEVRRGTRQ